MEEVQKMLEKIEFAKFVAMKDYYVSSGEYKHYCMGRYDALVRAAAIIRGEL